MEILILGGVVTALLVVVVWLTYKVEDANEDVSMLRSLASNTQSRAFKAIEELQQRVETLEEATVHNNRVIRDELVRLNDSIEGTDFEVDSMIEEFGQHVENVISALATKQDKKVTKAKKTTKKNKTNKK